MSTQPPGTGRLDPNYAGVSREPVETFNQPKITGYRQLSPVEVDLMNEAKALGSAFEELAGRLRRYLRVQRDEASAPLMDGMANHTAVHQALARLNDAEPERWLAMGRTDIQTGVMKIVRSIAQPAS